MAKEYIIELTSEIIDLDDNKWNDYEIFSKKIDEVLDDYDMEIEFNHNQLKLKSSVRNGYVKLHVIYPYDLSKEELLEIYYDYEENVKNKLKSEGIEIDLDIENIMEIQKL